MSRISVSENVLPKVFVRYGVNVLCKSRAVLCDDVRAPITGMPIGVCDAHCNHGVRVFHYWLLFAVSPPEQ